MSEAGMRVVIEGWTRNRAESGVASARWRAIEREKADAVYARPIDMERLAAALSADAEDEAERTRRRIEAGIAVLRRLSPEDRAIHARGFTTMQSVQPARTCGDDTAR
jgi:uncharacterized membrane protein